MPEVVAIVVARKNSKRLPGKALLPFGGSTLVGHKVQTLMLCDRISRVVVGSDSRAILDEARRHGAECILRDAYHCDESKCIANEMLADMADRVECDVIVWAHPTNPLIRPATYTAAIERYLEAEKQGRDSLLSVTAIRRHAWFGGTPLNYDPWSERHAFASELEPVLVQDGAIFIQAREAMRKNRYFFGDDPALFPVDEIEGLDIDTQRDYDVAQLLYPYSLVGQAVLA